jgi:hypothetical protein
MPFDLGEPRIEKCRLPGWKVTGPGLLLDTHNRCSGTSIRSASGRGEGEEDCFEDGFRHGEKCGPG